MNHGLTYIDARNHGHTKWFPTAEDRDAEFDARLAAVHDAHPGYTDTPAWLRKVER